MKTRRLLILAFCALVIVLSVPFAARKLSSLGPIAGHTAAPAQPPPAYVRSLHPNYPYSVIPGGAYSPAELRSANRLDAAVRAHYADFDLKNARMVQLTADRYQYVSYRLKDQIFWTQKKLRIPQGEYLLTDGVHFCRARCGNRLSDMPGKQVSLLEPETSLLSPPPIRPELLAKLDLTQAPPLGNLGQQFPETTDSSSRLAPALPPDSVAESPVDQPSRWQPNVPPGPPGGITVVPPGVSQSLPVQPVTGSAFPFGFPAGSSHPPFLIPEKPAPPVILPVPEPASIYLFLVTFVLSLWFLLRMMSSEERSNTSPPENAD